MCENFSISCKSCICKSDKGALKKLELTDHQFASDIPVDEAQFEISVKAIKGVRMPEELKVKKSGST